MLRDICAKTNQFNLALARLNELQIGEYFDTPDRHVVHIRLADRLADSGSIGALFARRDGNALIVEELCISCRAMGRMLEDIIVTEVVAHIAERFHVTRCNSSTRWDRGTSRRVAGSKPMRASTSAIRVALGGAMDAIASIDL